MNSNGHRRGLTLVELLIVVAVIALLVSILAPSLDRAMELARLGVCVAGQNNLGRATSQYQAHNNESFFPCVIVNHPQPGQVTYFWGTKGDPVDAEPSPFMQYAKRDDLLCPSVQWGDYVPQGGMRQPTTNYGYNSWCLDPGSFLWRFDKPTRKSIQIPNPAQLFVFADAAMAWAPWGQMIVQNSTHLEPPAGPFVQQPTTHFRHLDMTVAVSADGHAGPYELEGGTMTMPDYNLGFVGASNAPHYDIAN